MQNKLNPRGVIFIFILGLAVYFNSFWVDFIWDDLALVLENPLIRSFSNVFKIFLSNLSAQGDIFYRPIQNLTYMLDFFLFKFDYRGYHLTNILLHISVAILFYRLTLTLTQNSKLGNFAALLFLVSPLWVESVTYISGRADILMAVFILLSFIYYLKDKILFSLIFYIFALLSKEASLIYVLLLIFYISLFKKFNRKTASRLSVFLVITVLYAWLRSLALGSPNMVCREFPLYIRVLFFIKAIPRYLGLIFFPINQSMSYTVKLPASFFEKEVLLSFIFIIFLLLLFILSLKKEKKISFFMGWFLITLMPYSGIFPINAFFAEHFIYIPAMGVFVVFVWLLQKIKSKFIFNFIFLGYLIFFSLATIKYNFAWQDAFRFYKRIIKLSENSFAAYNNLGVIYLGQKNYQKAEELLKRALEIKPQFLEGRLNLARFYYLKEDYARAIGLAKGVLEKEPKNYLASDYLGTFYFKKGEYATAERYYQKAIALNPYYIPLWLDLHTFYKSLGEDEEAKKVREKIRKIDRYSLAELYFNEANALMDENKLDEALTCINKAFEINHGNGGYYNTRGVILRRKGDYTGALYNFKQALRISPANWEVYSNLGNLFAVRKDFPAAEKYFKKSVSLNKAFADGYFNLGLLYFERENFKEAENFFKKAISLNPSHTLAKEYLNKISTK